MRDQRPLMPADPVVHSASFSEGTHPDLRRTTLASVVGSFVEWYDYGIYAFVATTIAAVFFPSDDPTVGLLSTFAVFALSFFIRPIGGIVCGHFGDRIGRKPVLAFAIILMTLATAAIGLLPTYAHVGVWAPGLLLAARLVQGFSAGGEAVGAASFLGEWAPDRRRGYLLSWINAASILGLLFASALTAVLTASLSPEAFAGWGWRVPFLLAFPLGFIGFYIRNQLEDTPQFQRLDATRQVARAPVAEVFRSAGLLRQIGLALGISLVNGIAYYTLLTYLPTYLTREVGLPRVASTLAFTFAMVLIVVAIPIMGALSDRVGRKPLLITSCIGLLLFVYPGFWLMSRGGVFPAFCGLALLALIYAPYQAIIHATLVELYPTRVRYTAHGIGFNIATAAFGGTAPLIATWLIAKTGSVMAPAYYTMAAAIVSLLCIFAIRETAGLPLRGSEDDGAAAGPASTSAAPGGLS